MDTEKQELKARVEAMKPGDKIEFEGKLAVVVEAISNMPMGTGGRMDYQVFDTPFSFSHTIVRRPA